MNTPRIYAVNTIVMAEHMKNLTKKIRTISFDYAQIFHHRMVLVLRDAPRVTPSTSLHSSSGFFEAEIVWEIFRQARIVLDPLHVQVDVEDMQR